MSRKLSSCSRGTCDGTALREQPCAAARLLNLELPSWFLCECVVCCCVLGRSGYICQKVTRTFSGFMMRSRKRRECDRDMEHMESVGSKLLQLARVPVQSTRTPQFQLFRWALGLSSALFYDYMAYYLFVTHFSLPPCTASRFIRRHPSSRKLPRRPLALPFSFNSGQTPEAGVSGGETSSLMSDSSWTSLFVQKCFI